MTFEFTDGNACIVKLRGLSLIAMQDAHDLWVAKKTVDLSGVQRLNLDAA